LEGRWLLVTTLGSGGRNRSAASTWEVVDGSGLREHFVKLPPAQQGRLDGVGWAPTPEDVAAIDNQWTTLVPIDRGIVGARHEIFGPDGLDEALLRDPLAKDALWIIRQTYTFAPGGSRPSQEYHLLVARSEKDGGFSGDFVNATIAMAPLPIPIKLSGTFRLTRIPTPQPSLLARIGDLFRGCNGSP
jgi:hypothetical protein